MRDSEGLSESVLKGLSERFVGYGGKFDRALGVLQKKGVKMCCFGGAGRTLWVVVGVEGDQLVYDEMPYCSCRHFHYRVLAGKDELCYHILSVKMARDSGFFDKVSFSEDEYRLFLTLLVRDLVGRMRGKNIRAVKQRLVRASVAQPG